MPILELTIVGELPAPRRKDLAQHVADAAGRVLSVRPGGTWVLVRRVDRDDYAEEGGGPPPGVLPVFVRLLLRTVPQGEELARQATALTQAIADCCGRPAENVHVCYEPAALGRQAFGGQLVTR